jgi:hypothetical protein
MKQITRFWNWFQKNEQEIINAFFLGIGSNEISSLFEKKLDYVSKRIGFIIKIPKKSQEKHLIIFTGFGYRKLFPKIIALENQAPPLEHFIAQAFIKPLDELEKYKDGTDEPFVCDYYEIKISEIQIALLDYNVTTKHIKINLYLPHYRELLHFDDLESNIDWIVMHILGEIAFRKHLKEIHLHQLPFASNGLLPLVELPCFIEYLYKINSRKKTRII